MKGRAREEGGVAIALALVGAARVYSPAIANHEQNRAGHRRNLAAAQSGHKQVLALTSRATRPYIASVKWRNQVLALACLLVFLGFGVVYFRYWVIQKPFGIILFVGEGLDPKILAAARAHRGSEDGLLALDSFPHLALLRNASADSAHPDAAAATGAIATGVKMREGAIAVDADGKPLPNLLELARESGRMTGLVTDGRLTAPSAAGFYAHASVAERLALARQLLQSQIDVILGRGEEDFLSATAGEATPGSSGSLKSIEAAGYDLVQSLDALEEVPGWRRAQLFGLFPERSTGSEEALGSASGGGPELSDLVRRAIQLLQFNRGGYLLIVQVGSMRRAQSEEGEAGRVRAALEFDRALATAKEYAGNKSAIFVCGDVVDRSTRSRSNSEPEPRENDAQDVLAFGHGLGADGLQGVRESTFLFSLIEENL